MTFASHLTLVVCIFFALMATVAAFLFRTAAAPMWTKFIIPSLMIALACALTYFLPEILGFPYDTTMANLPKQAELIAFIPYDRENRVELWLREANESPRAYSVILDPALKEVLRRAQREQEQGDRVVLAKRKGGKRPGGVADIDGGDTPYEIRPDAFSLPDKGGG